MVLELRYTLANADINKGDLLTTSGVDGVYPPGLPVARVTKVERRAESLVHPASSALPQARVAGTTLQVLVLSPVGAALPPSPAVPSASAQVAPQLRVGTVSNEQRSKGSGK